MGRLEWEEGSRAEKINERKHANIEGVVDKIAQICWA
jgi:hypothetical protein